MPQDGYDLWLAATTDSRSSPRTLNGAETGSRWRREPGHVGEPMRLRCLCVEPRLRISITQWKRPVCIPVMSGAEPVGRAACRVVLTTGLRTGQGTCPVRAPVGAARCVRRSESLPGWRALGAVAGWFG